MGLIKKTALLLSLAAAGLAVPQATDGAADPAVDPAAGAANSSACAVVEQAYVKQLAENPKGTARVTAAQAFACLQSVPNKPEPAAKLITSYKAYAQWESTLAWLKDPPKEYGLPAVDIMGGLDEIFANTTSGKYQSEYEFQASIVKLVSKAHDGHFSFRPDVFRAFGFRNDMAADLVSISVDGREVPKLYNLGMVNGTKTSIGNVTFSLDQNGLPPAVTKINGQNATEFLVQQGLMFLLSQDQDSQWNAQFQVYSNPAGQPQVSASIIYFGDSLSLEYENGQKVTQENYAIIRQAANFTGVKTGEDFYERFCNPNAAVATPTNGTTTQPQPIQPTTTPSSPPTPNIPITGYPKPEVRDNGSNVTAGYFLTGQGYDDVAVLSVTGFAPESASFDVLEYVNNFQIVVADFLNKSKVAGKKRLVVDVSSNGGGLVAAGYELYTQIFPDTPLFQATNLRRTDALVQIAEIGYANLNKIFALAANPSSIGRNASQETLALVAIANSAIVASNLLPGGVFSAGGRVNYTTTEQIISPVTLKGDVFTAYQSTPQNETGQDFNLTGVGSRANPPPAVFKPEDVVILTDGTCGSTCTIFSYLMIMQQNVKTVTVGGRPQKGPMQSVGGVEGAQVFELEDIQQVAAASLILATPEQKAALNGTDVGILAEGYVLDRAAIPGGAGAVNGKNAFSHTDAETPLQFQYQAANCRFFYTKEMIFGPEVTWKRAVDAAFNDPDKFCVEGSQTPLMGVQEPSSAFFTPSAEGLSAQQPAKVNVSAAVSIHGAGSGPAMIGAVLVGMALLY